MHKKAPWEPQHTALLRHLMARTNCCHAPTNRYCPTGAKLRRAYSEAFEQTEEQEREGDHENQRNSKTAARLHR